MKENVNEILNSFSCIILFQKSIFGVFKLSYFHNLVQFFIIIGQLSKIDNFLGQDKFVKYRKSA